MDNDLVRDLDRLDNKFVAVVRAPMTESGFGMTFWGRLYVDTRTKRYIVTDQRKSGMRNSISFSVGEVSTCNENTIDLK